MVKRVDSLPPESTFDVDYVVIYKYADLDKSIAASQFKSLVGSLSSVGLQTAVRNGENETLLILTKLASDAYLHQEVYRSRVRDWLHGVKATSPDKDVQKALEDEPLTPSERLRIIYQLIVHPRNEGGAGITPKTGEWKHVEAIFAVHDPSYNRTWLKHMASSYLISIEDLDEIRERFGEKIAFYFAFTEAYFLALIGMALVGASAWLVLEPFSPVFAVVNSLLCVTFVEYWKFQERDLALRWGVKGVSTIETKRKEFLADKEIEDPLTGEKVKWFSNQKRLWRQLLQIPFALTAVLALGALIATCFAIEIFVSEVYDGPGKSILVFLPTGIITVTEPLVLGLLTAMARRLNNYENYETDAAYATAMTQKIFLLNFITSYLPIILTAFVYVPFAGILVPYLDVFSLTVQPFSDRPEDIKPMHNFSIDQNRLKAQVIYFTVTAQIVNQLLEVVVPAIKREGFSKYKRYKSQQAVKRGRTSVSASDHPDEASFLKRVRQEVDLEEYDVTVDFREMIIQYGYLSLFSVVWPLTPISFLVNNWIELRTDAVKICTEMQRPIPWRADSIGPWLDSLGFLTWLGSITTGAIVYMFRNGDVGPDGEPSQIKGWALLLTILCSEHIYLLVQMAVRYGISKLDSPGRQKEKAERYQVRKKYLEESFGLGIGHRESFSLTDEMITRASLEDEARRASVGGASLDEAFWARQRGPQEAAQVGITLMQQAANEESKKSK